MFITRSDPHFKALATKRIITRVEGYNELRALCHSLNAIGMSIEMFKPDSRLHLDPLTAEESRHQQGTHFEVTNTLKGTTTAQLPPGFDITQQPILVSVSDQGGINRVFLGYVQYKVGIMIVVLYDFQHRLWNDIKAAMKMAKVFKSFLSYSLLWNVNYGPKGPKLSFRRSRLLLKSFL